MILFLISCTERSNFYGEIRNLEARAFRNLKKAHGQTAFFFFVPLASPRAQPWHGFPISNVLVVYLNKTLSGISDIF